MSSMNAAVVADSFPAVSVVDARASVRPARWRGSAPRSGELVYRHSARRRCQRPCWSADFCSCRCSEASCSCWWRPVRRSCPRRPCRAGGSWCVAFRSSRRGSCGSRRTPYAARRKQAARQDRTAGRKCVAALFRAGERGVSDPLLPAVMENAEGRRLHLLRFRTGPGTTGMRDRYGHGLTGTEAGSRRYVATAGSTWRRRRPKSVWASRRPATPAGPDRCRRAGFSRAWSPQSARGEAWWLTTVALSAPAACMACGSKRRGRNRRRGCRAPPVR